MGRKRTKNNILPNFPLNNLGLVNGYFVDLGKKKKTLMVLTKSVFGSYRKCAIFYALLTLSLLLYHFFSTPKNNNNLIIKKLILTAAEHHQLTKAK